MYKYKNININVKEKYFGNFSHKVWTKVSAFHDEKRTVFDFPKRFQDNINLKYL